MYPDHYRTLRVPPTATQEEIRRAYRILAKRYHPDRVPEGQREWAREQMARINVAYEVLSDPRKRAEYDRTTGRRIKMAATVEAERGAAGGKAGAAWHLRRARERMRRQRLERQRAIATVGAATVSSILVTLLLAAWLLPLLSPGGNSWPQRLVHWLGMDTSVGVCSWGIILIAVWVMAWIAYKLTEL